MLRGLKPATALDIGAAGGGNTRVLRENGWDAVALEYTAAGAEVAHQRGIATLRADATALPLADQSLDLVLAFDVLEHIPDDDRAMAEVFRVLRPGGRFFIAVPADPRLWSAHDEAVGHVRRYTRETLTALLARGGFEFGPVDSWMVLLRPAVALRRRKTSQSDLMELHPVVNFGLRAIITAERYLPVKRRAGVSLFVLATRPH